MVSDDSGLRQLFYHGHSSWRECLLLRGSAQGLLKQDVHGQDPKARAHPRSLRDAGAHFTTPRGAGLSGSSSSSSSRGSSNRRKQQWRGVGFT